MCASSLLAVGAVALIAAAERVAITGVIDPGAAAALFDVSGIAVGNGAPIGMAALIGAWGVGALMNGQRPRWHSVAGLLIAAGLLSPFAWVALAGVLVWASAEGIAISREPRGQVSRFP